MTDVVACPAFVLPEALQSQGFALRREGDPDLPFLIQLYASTRANELAILPWTQNEKNAFLIQQFGAQRKHYYRFYADAAFDVLWQGERPVGRLYLHERRTRFNVMDIALMPTERGKGLGSAIMLAVQDHAAAFGKGVDLFVERYNPALNLYRRLGFTPIQEDETNLEMEWVPDGVS
jgi:GNAT superfamily N-acetyltransferase